MHVCFDWGGGFGGVGDVGEEGAKDVEPGGVFGSHGVFEVGSEFEQEGGCWGWCVVVGVKAALWADLAFKLLLTEQGGWTEESL